jgi:phosphoglucomutase
MSVKQLYDKWMNYPQLESYLKEALEALDETQIEDAFYQNLEFGTGGMRGEVGPGINRMNVYTIRKANEGFARYLLNKFHDVIHRGVVIAYDNRHYSKEFAMESAKVMASRGIKAFIFESLRPTPELSFAVRHLNAIGGIVVTASHNPPQYNGYKIYDENGCQLVPNLADQVIDYVNNIEDVFDLVIEEEEVLRAKGLIQTIGEAVDLEYINRVKEIQLNPNLDKSNLKLVFTPLHGTSNMIGRRVLRECGYHNLHVVEEQTIPDPNFSTVKSPNPEDAEAFTLAIELGKQVSADILIATDPDADRVGVAVKHKDDYILLTGNQTGAILINYILTQRRIQNRLPKEGIVYNTIVTSSFGAAIAKNYGVEVESTLTGFKFIGEKANEIKYTNKEFVFGYEESYGYLIADFVRDKDSIQSILLIAEAASYYKHFDKTLYDVLFELYEEYGYYIESLYSLVLKGKEGQERISRILDHFRNNELDQVAGLSVIAKEDYLLQKRVDHNGESRLTLPKSNVVKFFLEDGSWFVLRPSGTEPKMKLYVGVVSDGLQTSQTKNKAIETHVLSILNTVE